MRGRDPEDVRRDEAALALDVWLGFLGSETTVDDAAFESLCGRHGELAGELRRLRMGATRSESGSDDSSGMEREAALHSRLQDLARPLVRGSRYRREAVIARGGMGVIHRIHDLELDRTLAMKELAAGTVQSNVLAAARFLEEAHVTARLDHPGIVPIHEAGLDEQGRLYFAMKLVQGRDLKAIFDLVRDGREGWTQTRALGVLLKVCEAMAYAHSKGVIHRDLKPGNVMVGRFGEVYVMDWGIARVLGRKDPHDIRIQRECVTEVLSSLRREEREETPDSPLVTMDGVVVGTPAYMPPEQARGEIQLLSPRSDVYSIGAMLYHLIAGQIPYVQPGARYSKYSLLARVVDGPPLPVHELNPSAPGELVSICQKAMSRDPMQRYPDTGSLGEDLRAYLERRVVHAHESGAIPELKKWIGRNKGLALASAAAILALFLGMTASSSLYFVAAKETTRANAEARESDLRAKEVLRLSDLQELDDLRADADELWPIAPEMVGKLEHWLDRAARLSKSLPEHESTLAALQATQAADPWWRNQLAKLIAGVKALDDPETGLVAGLSPEHGWGVGPRLELARSIRERTIDGPEAAEDWRRAIASIRDRDQCPAYGGLELTPQLGLLPIGRDPGSGLWEFAHLLSGAPAERGADGRLEIRPETGLVFVLIPGGSAVLGAQTTDADQTHYLDWPTRAAPVRAAMLQPYFISKYEMTQAQWKRFTGRNPSDNIDGLTAPLRPVEFVTWSECTQVLERLGLALPTEEQWECAARGGTDMAWWTGQEPSSLDGAENLADRSAARAVSAGLIGFLSHEDWLDDRAATTALVGNYDANPFGLHDVHGNVAEWCNSGADSYAVMPAEGYAIFRGGSWQSLALISSSAERSIGRIGMERNDLGVRPARALDSR